MLLNKNRLTKFRSRQSVRLLAIQKVALRKLMLIDNAKSLEDLRVPPKNHLEQLVEDRKGQYSIRINDQWRVCFVENNGHFYDVEIVDYH
ncbi:MAG: type II toxin-antitoxin system RelE/ParE family toxin [Treponema sp.]|nr:type II toxin-antitoxin system RelE/ParE family toxin [Treponema sp.]